MTKFGKLPPRQKVDSATDDGFGLVPILIGAVTVLARPYEFFTDLGGKRKPSKLALACPACGHGIFVDVKLGVDSIIGACDNCGAGASAIPQPLTDPFVNPITAGLISRAEIDPLYAAAMAAPVLDLSEPVAPPAAQSDVLDMGEEE